MKKITLLTAAAMIAGVFSQAQEVRLSHSADPETIDTGGVACWNNANGEYRDNHFARTYDLAAFDIEGDFQINSIEFGVGSADDGKTVLVNIYTVDTEDLAEATFTLISDGALELNSTDNMTLKSYNIEALIPAGSIVAIEVVGPDEGDVGFQRYFPGFNLSGETGPGWLKSLGCSIEWTPASSVVAGQEYVMNLVGEEVEVSVGEHLLSGVSVFPNPATDIINVSVPSSVEITGVALFDILGKNTGVTISNGQIDIANLAKGVYMLSVETTAGTLTKKVVKR